VPSSCFNEKLSCQLELLTVPMKQPNDLLYTHISIPRPEVSSQWLDRSSQALFKTQSVQGGSDINAARSTGLSGLGGNKYSDKLRCVFDCKKTFSFKGVSFERNESVPGLVCALRGVERSCALCDVLGRGAR